MADDVPGGRVLALIPARGGSKGVPRKNIRPLAGKPLIAWTIEAACAAQRVDRVVVSSEDDEILQVARAWGAETPWVRPAELARDETPGIDVVMHALSLLPGYEWVVLLQPTSPLRTVQDIEGALRLCWKTGAPSCVGVTPASCNPWWMFGVEATGRLRPLLSPEQRFNRRQDAPELFELNGAIYVAHVGWLRRTGSLIGDETVGYVMDPLWSVDIDTELDFEWAEFLMRRRLSESSGP